VRRHRGPHASPSMGPGPTMWLAGVAQRTRQRRLATTTCLPAMLAAHRFASITYRSPTVHAVGGAFIPRSPACQRRHHSRREATTQYPEATPRPGMQRLPSPRCSEGSRLWLAQIPPRSTASSTRASGQQHQSKPLPRHRCGPDARPPSLRPPSTLQVRVAAPAGPAVKWGAGAVATPRFLLPLPKPCMRCYLTRLSTRQSTSRIPPRHRR